MRRQYAIQAVIAGLVMIFAAPATAQVCEPEVIQSSLQYLRRASLDLRGRLPTIDEMESVVATGEVDPMLIDQMLDTEDFTERMRAYHMELLWTNLAGQRLVANTFLLSPPTPRTGSTAYFLIQRAIRLRGDRVACADRPATFDRDGTIQTQPHPTLEGVVQEGYVEVEPFWAPGTTVRVCAFDAQDAESAPSDRNPNAMIECSSSGAPQASGCGCGPNLRHCSVRAGETNTTGDIIESLAEQLLRYSDDIVRNDRPYTDFLMGTDMEINGPISHYLRHQTRTGGNQFLALPEQNYPVPEVDFTEDDRWVQIERGERHAGILTMPGYLVKFQTNRSRANRFYNAFLCTAFEAPPGGLPASDDDCNNEPNLTERCGCKHCHIAVEPAAAHWGRFGEAGLAALNEDLFPSFNETCTTQRGQNSNLCRLFYFTEANHPDEEPYVGMLNAFVFADETIETNIELGPAAIAQKAIENGEFARCTTRKMWRALMGRDALLEDEAAIETLAGQFIEDEYSIRELVYSIVTRPEYIEGERFGTKEVTP